MRRWLLLLALGGGGALAGGMLGMHLVPRAPALDAAPTVTAPAAAISASTEQPITPGEYAPEPEVGEVDKSPPVAGATLRVWTGALGTLAGPLSNGGGLVLGDVPISLVVDAGVVQIIRWQADGPTTQRVSVGSDPAMWLDEPYLRVVYRLGEYMMIRSSVDYGLTWDQPYALGRLTGSGSPTPSGACGHVAWVDAPTQASTGQLHVRRLDGAVWRTVEAEHATSATSPSIACGPVPYVAYRDQPAGSAGSRLSFGALGASVEPAGSLSDGYDPSIAACADRLVVGYHDRRGQMRLALGDETAVIDPDGKFAAVACYATADQPHAVAVWGDYPRDLVHQPTTAEGQAARRLGLYREGLPAVDLPPELTGDAGPAHVAVTDDGEVWVAVQARTARRAYLWGPVR